MTNQDIVSILSGLTPELATVQNKQNLLRIFQLQAAQSGTALSPELVAFLSDNQPGINQDLFNNVLTSLAPEKPQEFKTGWEGVKQGLMGQGQYGFKPHMAGLQGLMQNMNQSMQPQGGQNMAGNMAGSSFGAAQDAYNAPKTWGEKALHYGGAGVKMFAPLIGGAAAAAGGGPAGGMLANQGADLLGEGLQYLGSRTNHGFNQGMY